MTMCKIHTSASETLFEILSTSLCFLSLTFLIYTVNSEPQIDYLGEVSLKSVQPLQTSGWKMAVLMRFIGITEPDNNEDTAFHQLPFFPSSKVSCIRSVSDQSECSALMLCHYLCDHCVFQWSSLTSGDWIFVFCFFTHLNIFEVRIKLDESPFFSKFLV